MAPLDSVVPLATPPLKTYWIAPELSVVARAEPVSSWYEPLLTCVLLAVAPANTYWIAPLETVVLVAEPGVEILEGIGVHRRVADRAGRHDLRGAGRDHGAGRRAAGVDLLLRTARQDGAAGRATEHQLIAGALHRRAERRAAAQHALDTA